MPFWAWDQPGAFFGMPYQNFAGWFGTGVVFMSVATLLWRLKPKQWADNISLELPLNIYISNFLFAMLISIDGKIYLPILLGLLLGVLPLVWLYRLATKAERVAYGSQWPQKWAKNTGGLVASASKGAE